MIVKLDNGNTYNVRYLASLPGYSGPSITNTSTTGKTTLEVFNIPGDSLPFADNMVTPDFTKFPDAKIAFDNGYKIDISEFKNDVYIFFFNFIF